MKDACASTIFAIVLAHCSVNKTRAVSIIVRSGKRSRLRPSAGRARRTQFDGAAWGPRTSRPGIAPVGSPFSSVTSPLTIV